MSADKNAIETYLSKMEEIKLSDGSMTDTYQTQRRIEAHLEFLCYLGVSELEAKARDADTLKLMLEKLERSRELDSKVAEILARKN